MKKDNLATLGEFGWLKKLLPRLFWPSTLRSHLRIGPGDDAGVLRLSPHRVLVATTDALVEGIHFERRWFPWKELGEKALAVNLSDLAAMGAVTPLAALLTVAVPGDTPVDFVDKLYTGLDKCARRYKIGFLGGDTVGSRRDLFISVTVFGEADPAHLIRRKGARPGDLIVSTGALGQAAAGLEVLQRGKSSLAWTRPLVRAFRQPQPRLQEGALLGRHHWASSMIDCSDGLEASVRLLAEASQLGVEINLELLPISSSLVRWASLRKRPAWTYALRGGEDYGLIFTIKPPLWPKVKDAVPGTIIIGKMVPRTAGCCAKLNHRLIPLKSYGFRHFQ